MPLNRLVDSGASLPPPDTQRTSFSIDGLARFVCNTWDEALAAQGDQPFDVVIVGSGMYGAYTAAKLFELGVRMSNQSDAPRILVLESGPLLITEHIQNLTRRSTGLGALVAENLVDPGQTNESSLVKHFRCVGGKSLFWGGWAPRYQREDVRRVDEQGDRLWPEDIENYLFEGGYRGGYQHCEREIGVYPSKDFISGPLQNSLKSMAQKVIDRGTVSTLKAAMDPPIAVQGDSPGSGLFSFDKFSSLPLLLDSIREDAELAAGKDTSRRLFLVPNVEVLKLETANGRVHQVVAALTDPSDPKNKLRSRVVRLNLKSSAMVVLAGNTINSTRLALNSFPRTFGDGELMGRNLMYHVRGNYVWRVKRSALNLPPPDPANIKIAALHVTGAAPTTAHGLGQFHFQVYAAPNMDVPMFPGASRDPERFLYLMTPNIEDLESIREAQSGLGNDRVAIGIRTVGETFGDRTSPIGSNLNTSWMSVNPFGGAGDDVYREFGQELRIPKAYVNLVRVSGDSEVLAAQDKAAFDFITALASQGTPASPSTPSPVVSDVIATIALNVIPDNSYRMENTPGGRFFIGRFSGQYRVLNGACTHEGCFVDWDGGARHFTCPCHTAIFGSDGTNISGPPPKPLHQPVFRVVGPNLEIIDPNTTNPVELVGGGADGIGTTYHEAGTLWMGVDPLKSVTDTNGRFHHVTNAYCVDQSLFPTAGSANPVLTGIALSRKVATSIIDRYCSEEDEAAEPGFTSLYTGDFALDGWKAAGCSNFFNVSHSPRPVLGVGVDNQQPALGALWYAKRTFKNFVLKLDWRAYDVSANAGIFLRMPEPVSLDSNFYDSTIEVQIDEHGRDHRNGTAGSPWHKTGSVYGVFPARQWAAKAVQPRGSGKGPFWNRCEIEVKNATIKVRVNQMLVAQGRFSALLPFSAPSAGTAKRAEGYIGLQCHTEVVQFQNIRIKEL